MFNYKIFSRSDCFAVGLILLSFFLFESSVFARLNSLPIKSAAGEDLSIPLKLCFNKQNDNISPVGFASDNISSLFVAFQTGKLEKVNLEKKTTTWSSDLGGEIFSDLVFENNRVYFITKISDGSFDKRHDDEKSVTEYLLWSIDAGTGVTLWQFRFSSNGLVSLNEFQYKLFLTIDDGTIIVVRKHDGQKILNKQTGQKFGTSPSFSGNNVFIADKANSIIVISAENGEVVSKLSDLRSSATTITANGDNLYWGEEGGLVNLAKISSKNRIWSVRYGGEIYSLALVSNGLLISSLDNFVYLISLQKGKKIWKKRLAGRISAKPLITGSFVVFFTAADNNVTIVDLRDGKIVNQISLKDKGFVLSTPLIVNHQLVFLTTKGIFAFTGANLNCTTD